MRRQWSKETWEAGLRQLLAVAAREALFYCPKVVTSQRRQFLAQGKPLTWNRVRQAILDEKARQATHATIQKRTADSSVSMRAIQHCQECAPKNVPRLSLESAMDHLALAHYAVLAQL